MVAVKHRNSMPMESDGICTNLFIEIFLKTYQWYLSCELNKNSTSLSRGEVDLPGYVYSMFRNFIDGSQHAVWHLKVRFLRIMKIAVNMLSHSQGLLPLQQPPVYIPVFTVHAGLGYKKTHPVRAWQSR